MKKKILKKIKKITFSSSAIRADNLNIALNAKFNLTINTIIFLFNKDISK